MTTPISRHITLEQLCATSHPVDNHLQQVLRYGRIHTAEQIRRDLERTARTLMDPLVDQFGPGVISSGYRCPALNAAVGGAANSAHLVGLAVDWQPSGTTIRQVILWATAQPALPYDRLIVEERGGTHWLHVQAPSEGPGAPARALYESPRPGVYTAMRVDQVGAIPV